MAKKIKIDDLKVVDELSKDDLKSVSGGASSDTSNKKVGNTTTSLLGDDFGVPRDGEKLIGDDFGVPRDGEKLIGDDFGVPKKRR